MVEEPNPSHYTPRVVISVCGVDDPALEIGRRFSVSDPKCRIRCYLTSSRGVRRTILGRFAREWLVF
jgi:hypothetical protein